MSSLRLRQGAVSVQFSLLQSKHVVMSLSCMRLDLSEEAKYNSVQTFRVISLFGPTVDFGGLAMAYCHCEPGTDLVNPLVVVVLTMLNSLSRSIADRTAKKKGCKLRQKTA
jgi:hypothetical protein